MLKFKYQARVHDTLIQSLHLLRAHSTHTKYTAPILFLMYMHAHRHTDTIYYINTHTTLHTTEYTTYIHTHVHTHTHTHNTHIQNCMHVIPLSLRGQHVLCFVDIVIPTLSLLISLNYQNIIIIIHILSITSKALYIQ